MVNIRIKAAAPRLPDNFGKQPEKWVFFEIYASDAAYQKHRATPHFQDYLRQTADMVADKSFSEIRPALLMSKGKTRFEAE